MRLVEAILLHGGEMGKRKPVPWENGLSLGAMVMRRHQFVTREHQNHKLVK